MAQIQISKSPNPEKRRLLLIDPYPEDNPYRMNPSEQRVIWFPKLSLPVIASRTPSRWDIRIIDESSQIVRPEWIDQMIREAGVENLLVGISTQMTCYTPRAYEIADQFRARGVPVALGGTHATYCPEEAKQHADTVIKFEADEVWPRVIQDFESGKLQPFYEMESYPVMKHTPEARVDLLPEGSYMTHQCLQTTRGCHFECEFCSVSPFNGKSSRRRTVEEVVAEIQHIRQMTRGRMYEKMVRGPVWHRVTAGLRILTGLENSRIFAFVDDLHNSNRDYCKKLWTALKELDIKWGAQCTLFLGSEPDMVKLAAESGCVAMFVGMESISRETLIEMKKPFNHEKQYADQIKCFHDHGIMVNPGVIFGSDEEDESVFETTVNFLTGCGVELAYMNILTPLPGTPLFDRMKAQGRIFDWDWSHYDGKSVVYTPTRMTPEALQEGFFWANRKFYTWPSIFRRLVHTHQRIPARFMMNRGFRRLIYRTTPRAHLSPVGAVIQKLQARLPSLETEHLVPNAMCAIKETVQNVSEQIDQLLIIQPQKTLQAILVDLSGTLDLHNVRELKRRLAETARKTRMDIVVNFEHLHHAAPAALQSLVELDFLEKILPYGRIRYMNLKQAFQEVVEQIPLSAFESRQEESVA